MLSNINKSEITAICETITKILNAIEQANNSFISTWEVEVGDVPQQLNSYDCGVYAIALGKLFAANKNIRYVNPVLWRAKIRWSFLLKNYDFRQGGKLGITNLPFEYQTGVEYISLEELEIFQPILSEEKSKIKSLLSCNRPTGNRKALKKELCYNANWFKNGEPLFSYMNPYGDGNCLLRCVSWFIDGTDKHVAPLRLILLLELIKYQKWYQSLEDRGISERFTQHWPSIMETAFRCSGYLSIIHLFALANSLNRVFLLYGPQWMSENYCGACFPIRRNGHSLDQSHAFPIAWSSLEGNGDMNHFVALSPNSDRHQLPMLRPVFWDHTAHQNLQLYRNIALCLDY
mmetsp:Transcript_8330/g.13219  ORF Transcript_8330/g.13219 Transcript_8330/m.13219 type:complete len:346 (-) Transcript_8330:85-1122(-)